MKSWEHIGKRPHHGIDVFLPALRSANSSGIGEFLDLIPLIDWCKELGMDVIQLLPLNDSGDDPSPYNALSSCALNPAYISLASPLKISGNYREVRKLKMQALYSQFQQFSPDPHYLKFVQDNPWLQAYAGEPPAFHFFLQYLCFSQLKKVKDYATSQGVFLQGDIPILISRNSADVKHSPELFDLTLEAGAPPDPYNQNGQVWGFPLFNWEEMKKQNYAWWKQRLEYAGHFYDMYRIDHVVGFFRIWGVPHGKPPKEGFFVPSNTSLWMPQGTDLLKMIIASSEMLPLAEDLGTIPDGVRERLADLDICGTKVIRWERFWKTDRSFIPFEQYPPLSMTCVSTHDSETLQLWWKNAPEEAKAFAAFKHWDYTPELSMQQRQEILRDSHHTPSFFHINLLQEYLALFPELVSPDPERERINVPGTLLPTNWEYRYRPSIEEMRAHPGLNHAIQKLLH